MKARVKVTNQIVEVEEYSKYLDTGWKYRDINTGTLYKAGSLDFSAEAVVGYWERLEHQYAGMALQGMLSNPSITERELTTRKGIVEDAIRISHALVEKLKNSNIEKEQ